MPNKDLKGAADQQWSRLLLLSFYNLCQLPALILVGPLLLVKAILTPKYRGRVLKRCGMGLDAPASLSAGPRIWLHALSVGEVSSVRSLVRLLRQEMPDAVIILSATTRTGEEFARESLHREVDVFMPFPFDILPVVRLFLRRLAPDLFVLVETDFWPNVLLSLKLKNIPAILVNGRISLHSARNYRRFGFLFRPLFSTFSSLAMQTAADVQRLGELGVPAGKLVVVGNLKYDSALPAQGASRGRSRQDFGIPEQASLWIAGSTHPGEEEVIFRVCRRLLPRFPELFLVVAPRQVERSSQLFSLALAHGLQAAARSAGPAGLAARVLVLDTLGELAGLYQLCDVAFVGGSLVPEGGHNPLEPAAFAKPVLFGPHMADFSEIAADLIATGGGRQVQDEEELFAATGEWLADADLRKTCGSLAFSLLQQHRGAAARHLGQIRKALGREGSRG